MPDDTSVATHDPDPEPNSENKAAIVKDKSSSVVKDVMTKQGLYGMFTDGWFSKRGWKTGSKSHQGSSNQDDLQKMKSAPHDPSVADGNVIDTSTPALGDQTRPSQDDRDQLAPAEVVESLQKTPAAKEIALLPKVLTTTKVFLGSKNFFFCYDHDLSRTVSEQNGSGTLALHQTFKHKVRRVL